MKKNVSRWLSIGFVFVFLSLCGCGDKAVSGSFRLDQILIKASEGTDLPLKDYLPEVEITITENEEKKNGVSFSADPEEEVRVEEAIRVAFNRAIDEKNGIVGQWSTTANVLPAFDNALSSTTGADVNGSTGLEIGAKVVFSREGIYAFFLDKKELSARAGELVDSYAPIMYDRISKMSDEGSVITKALRGLIENKPMEKGMRALVKNTIDSTIDNLNNGVAGTYELHEDMILFADRSEYCTFTINGNVITIGEGNLTGMLGIALAPGTELTKINEG